MNSVTEKVQTTDTQFLSKPSQVLKHNKKAFRCCFPTCEWLFVQRGSWKNHMYNHHGLVIVPKYLCDFCARPDCSAEQQEDTNKLQDKIEKQLTTKRKKQLEKRISNLNNGEKDQSTDSKKSKLDLNTSATESDTQNPYLAEFEIDDGSDKENVPVQQ